MALSPSIPIQKPERGFTRACHLLHKKAKLLRHAELFAIYKGMGRGTCDLSHFADRAGGVFWESSLCDIAGGTRSERRCNVFPPRDVSGFKMTLRGRFTTANP